MTYLIFEIETGMVDGYYTSRRDARALRKYWADARPGRTHILMRVDGKPQYYLPDAIMLNRLELGRRKEVKA